MINLPKKVLIPKSIAIDKQYNSISDYLSDEYGFCVFSFIVTFEKNRIYADKIEWDVTQ